MTPDEFNNIFDKICARCEFPRQVWTYNSEPPPGLLSPRRFTEEYWHEFMKIKADEFQEVVDTWFRNAKHRKFPFVDELRTLYTELFWAVHQREREKEEETRQAALAEQDQQRFERITAEIQAWPEKRQAEFLAKKKNILDKCGYFVTLDGLKHGLERYATVQAYLEMEGNKWKS